MIDKTSSKFIMHFSVFLFGFTAILGRLITTNAIMIVWWRVVFTIVSLIAILYFSKKIVKIPRKLVYQYLFIGGLIMIHWVCFYASVKLANASIALICLATTSFFTAMFEPLIFKKRINVVDLLIGCLIIPCMYFITNAISPTSYLGVSIGITAAIVASIFSLLNKKLVDQSDPYVLTFYEMIGVLVSLTLLLPIFARIVPDFTFMPASTIDWFYLTVLAVVCTTVAWVGTIIALKNMTAFESILIVNLEPVYGIIMAAVILKEHQQLNINFYIGALLIITIVGTYPYIKEKYAIGTR